MRNLGAWGALLVIFVGSFYMGKATTYHKDPNKTASKEALRKDKRNAKSKSAFNKKEKGHNRYPQSIKTSGLAGEKLKNYFSIYKKGTLSKNGKDYEGQRGK